jgi:DNA-binding PadR family transcriptional regulator
MTPKPKRQLTREAALPQPPGLNDHEGIFLALLARMQPATAYQLSKVYERSPVSNYKTHKGKIYPIIERLTARGYLEKRAVAGDRRGTEHLVCTPAGRDAVRRWVLEIQPHHLLPDDLLRTKLQSFDLLSQQQRLAWVESARAQLQAKLSELDAYGREVDVPYKYFVHDNAIRTLRARIDWLDSLFADLARGAT